MNELEKTGNYLEHFFASDKMMTLLDVCVKVALIVVVGLILIKIILKITKRSLRKSEADPSVYTFVHNAVKAVCTIVLVTMCLGAMGIPMSTLIAVIGAAGAAIALALKDSLANVAGGVMIIITQPFSKGDLIDLGEISGKVEKIDLFLTTLKTHDNKIITVPNGLLNTSVLVNHSKESKRRVDCTFGIGYDNDICRVKDILGDVCKTNSAILEEPAPLIGVADHGDNAVILDVKVWCETDDYWDVKYFLEENVKLAFDANGIDIPYPQMDVHLKQE